MIACVVVMVIALSPPAATAPPPRDLAVLVSEASAAMARGDFEGAATAYAEAAAQQPDSAELAYNLGVARFRKGEHEAAEESFRQAASMATGDLRNRAMFNMGTSAYARALKAAQRAPGPDSGQGDANPLQDATSSIKEAIEHFARTLAEKPVDEDARVNGELSHRLRRMLEQLQNEQQQQGDRQAQQENPQREQQQQDQQQQDQQQQDQPQQGEPSQQQTQPQDSESESSQDSQSSPQSGSESESKPAEETPQEGVEKEQEHNQPPHGQPQEQEPQEPQEQKGKPASAQAGDESDRPMTQDEVERILQTVRDKERRRREHVASQSSNQPRRPRAPEKDW